MRKQDMQEDTEYIGFATPEQRKNNRRALLIVLAVLAVLSVVAILLLRIWLAAHS